MWLDPTLFSDEAQPDGYGSEEAEHFSAELVKALGLPAEQAWKILNGGVDFYAITPKVGVMPKVFVSDIAGTGQGAVANAASGKQVIVPNRSLWTEPKPINPLTLR